MLRQELLDLLFGQYFAQVVIVSLQFTARHGFIDYLIPIALQYGNGRGVDCTTDTGVISGLQQALGAGHVGVIQFLPMFPAFVTVAEIGSRMKQGITPL
ncbi:hypothetical protein D3C76_1604900 [compost metagenome]